MNSWIKRYYRLLYAGFVLAKQHAVSYIATSISSFFWFLIIMLPATLYADNPEVLVVFYTPAYFALFIAIIGAMSSVEFLRWYVYEGLTDVYREAGLGVYHYVVSTWFADFLIALFSFIMLALVVGQNTGLGAFWFTRISNPLFVPLIPLAAFSVEVFFGGLIALVYTHTRLGVGFQGFIQMVIVVSTYTPLWRLPNPLLGLINPAVYFAELVRLLYGYSTIHRDVLLVLSPVLIVLYYLVGYVMFRSADRVIAMYGVEFRV